MEYAKFTVLCIGHEDEIDSKLHARGFVHVRHDAHALPLLMRAQAEGATACILLDLKQGYTQDDVCLMAERWEQSQESLLVATHAGEKPGLPDKVFGFLSAVSVSDASFGLFAFGEELLALFCEMKTKEHSLLQDMVLEARSAQIEITEVKTQVKAPAPAGFGVLTKSMKLYAVFIKFSISAMISYIVDIASFFFLQKLFAAMSDEFKVLYATIISRVLCSLVTYLLNKGAVFRSQAHPTGAVLRFVILSVGQLTASWLLVWGLGHLLGGNDLVNTGLKVVVDFVIFMASFTLQRDWVFKDTPGLLK